MDKKQPLLSNVDVPAPAEDDDVEAAIGPEGAKVYRRGLCAQITCWMFACVRDYVAMVVLSIFYWGIACILLFLLNTVVDVSGFMIYYGHIGLIGMKYIANTFPWTLFVMDMMYYVMCIGHVVFVVGALTETFMRLVGWYP